MRCRGLGTAAQRCRASGCCRRSGRLDSLERGRPVMRLRRPVRVRVMRLRRRRFGFVKYKAKEAATAALAKLGGRELADFPGQTVRARRPRRCRHAGLHSAPT
jgi:hypothetical protein